MEGDGDFFKGGVAGPFADAVDGDFDLAGSAHDAVQGVGGGHAEVVVAVAAKDGFVAVGDVGDDVGEELAVLVRGCVAGGVGDVDNGSSGGDDGFDDLVDVFFIGPAGVFHEVLDIVGELAGEFDGLDADIEGLLAAHFELVFEVVFADAEASVDPSTFRGFEGFGGDLDVFGSGAGQAADGDAFEFFGEGFDGLEVTGGGDGEAGFDDVDSEVDEGMADFQFLGHVQAHAWALFAVSKGRIEDVYLFRHRMPYPQFEGLLD